MLGSRNITATLAGETVEQPVAKGCPQGGHFITSGVDELI